MNRVVLIVALSVAVVSGRAEATIGRRLDFPLRGKMLTLTVYQPAAVPKGTVIM